ncbi:core-2/I-Branching enzyme [Rhodococcus rhodochrous J38]|uniref:beta-1,6-N-acetylglucosaminyltransferase n=1 Tax=Rhodococcus rhodochrous TaxID=1829 RepID=UPI0011ACA704|nr:beta-1,6-N-acetylglucosaminyltransferase [Rhodococcus rhodochrous]TWH52960.1 core-2/I-Branching enzyme [Rhodococcus rhodochrous J38]
MSVRAAVLIQAHRHPELFRTLVDSLRHPAIDIYLHIDATSDLEPFEDAVPEDDAVTYLRGAQRVDVHWGGLSQIEAMLALVRAARATGHDYDRFALLSGSDIRVAPLDHILTAWASSTEFLRLDRCLAAPGMRAPARVSRRHFPDRPGGVLQHVSGRIPRRVDTTVDLHQGSQWWALTAAAVDHVTTFLDRHPSWLRFHRHTFCPDEIVVHSILAASPLRDRIAQDHTAGTDTDRLADPLHGMHYIDWSDPLAANPRLLTPADAPVLLASGAFFARKADPATAAELVAALRQETAT